MSIKKTIARELIWFFVALLGAVPISLLFNYLLNLSPEGEVATLQEKVLQLDFILIIGLLIGFVFVYLVRLISWAIKMVVAP